MVGNKRIILENRDSNTNLKLSARISADSFVYGVFDKSFNLCYAAKYGEGYDLDIMYSEIKHLNPKELNFIFTSAPFFHSPFEDESLIDHMPSFHGKSLLKDHNNSVYTYYGIDRPFYDFIDRFQNKRCHHISNLMMSTEADGYENCLAAFFESNKLHLSHATADGLKFYNQYEFKDKNDILYWISAVYETLNLNKKNIPLAITGQVSTDHDLFKFISSYVPIVTVGNFRGRHQAKVSENQRLLFDLHQAILCE